MGEAKEEISCARCHRMIEESEETETRAVIGGPENIICSDCLNFEKLQDLIRDDGPAAFGWNRILEGTTVIVEVLREDVDYQAIKSMIEKDRRAILGFMRGPGTFYHTAIPKTES